MKIFVEGMYWMGKWTEISIDALSALGHQTGCFYHNKKDFCGRLSAKLNTALSAIGIQSKMFLPWEAEAKKRLIKELSKEKWDVLISIQGKLDPSTTATLRNIHPNIKIVCWWGDPLTPRAKQMVEDLSGHVNMHLFSWKGDYEYFHTRSTQAALYFPFAVSLQHYKEPAISASERKKYSSPVSFVGSYYPERCELIRFLNVHLDEPVTVWGRRWRKCSDVVSRGALTMEETLKVYACSKISLNMNPAHGPNGLNMKFYEIPASGGFEICDSQPVLNEMIFGKDVVTFSDRNDLLEKITYYLHADQEREQIRKKHRDMLLEHETYEKRFEHLLQKI